MSSVTVTDNTPDKEWEAVIVATSTNWCFGGESMQRSSGREDFFAANCANDANGPQRIATLQ